MKPSVAGSVLFLAATAVGCGTQAPSAPEPETYNETFMVAQVIRIERAMNIGSFDVLFTTPPKESYAGWAYCNGNTQPFRIAFNKNYINGLPVSKEPYMTSLVAHEMCHHYVGVKGGSCWDEIAAETCARRFE